MNTSTHDEALHPRETTGKFAAKPVSEVAGGLDALGAPAAPPREYPPLEEGHQRGEFAVFNSSMEELPDLDASGGVAFRRTKIHIGGRPDLRAASAAAAARMQRAGGDRNITGELFELAERGEKVTVLYAQSSGDVVAKEGTLAMHGPADDAATAIAIMHKGSRAKGIYLFRRPQTPASTQILGVRKGYGHSEALASEFRAHAEQIPATEKVHFDGVPDVGDARAPREIAAAFVITHPGFDGSQDGRGSVFFATDIQAGDGIVNGYGVYPAESGLTSEHGSMYVKDLERMGGRVAGLRPGAITYNDVIALDEKASAYSDGGGDFEPTWAALRAASS